jgi:hypothetical protein
VIEQAIVSCWPFTSFSLTSAFDWSGHEPALRSRKSSVCARLGLFLMIYWNDLKGPFKQQLAENLGD